MYSVALLSLLAGATVVHQLFKPDLTLPVARSSEGSHESPADGGDAR